MTMSEIREELERVNHEWEQYLISDSAMEEQLLNSLRDLSSSNYDLHHMLSDRLIDFFVERAEMYLQAESLGAKVTQMSGGRRRLIFLVRFRCIDPS